MAYFLIQTNEDGMYIRTYKSAQGVQELLNDTSIREDSRPHPVAQIPANNWAEWPENTIVIIKGEIVVPQKAMVVEKYILED